jgi:hypothetical protein
MKPQLHYIPADVYLRKIITMGIQYFVTLSEVKSTYYFQTTDGSISSKFLIIQGFKEQPDLDFLTFMQ